MNICIVVDNLDESAGWGRLAKKIGGNLEERGYKVGYITQGETSENACILPLRNLHLNQPLKIINSIRTFRAFARDYDSVVCFDINPYGIITAASLIGTGKKFYIYCLGTYSLFTKNFLRNILMKFAVHNATGVFVVGNFLKSKIEQGGLMLGNTPILPVGVDLNFFKKTETSPRVVPAPYIIGVGGIKHRKGFHLSIEAFSKIAGEFPSLKYLIVGRKETDDYFIFLNELIKKYHLEERVVFLHNADDLTLRDLLNGAELFVLTPVTQDNALEGFGMVYLEAAQCGLSAVGTKDSGAQEAIVGGETGLLVDSNPEAIAEALRKILKDGNMREMMSHNAVKRVEQFSWKNVTDKLIRYIS